mgnify:CR=1 FL=1
MKTFGQFITNYSNCIFISDPNYINHGSQLAITFHKDIINLVFEMLEKKLIRNTSEYRYSVLKEEIFTEKFCYNHSTFYQIANLLQMIYSEVSRKVSSKNIEKSFLLAVEDKKRMSYHVFGLFNENKIEGKQIKKSVYKYFFE